MPTTLTSEGQVGIPKRIRDSPRLLPGAAVEFSFSHQGVVVLHPPRARAVGTEAPNDRSEAVRGRADVVWRTDDLVKPLRSPD